jgi:hypothetical protein
MASFPGLEAGHDPLLRPFLESPDEETARSHLSDLLERHASPLVRDVLRGQLPDRAGGSADSADVHSGVLLRLTAHLWALRGEPGAEPLASFAGYVAAASHNACHAFFRNRYPQRSRLRNKVRYVLTREPGLALWAASGTSGWRPQRVKDQAASLGAPSAWRKPAAGWDRGRSRSWCAPSSTRREVPAAWTSSPRPWGACWA